LIDVPVGTAAKAALHMAMRSARVRPSHLARKLDWNLKEVHRLLDPRQPASLSKLERALSALGKRLVLAVDEAA
jgi:antitoxin HicB